MNLALRQMAITLCGMSLVLAGCWGGGDDEAIPTTSPTTASPSVSPTPTLAPTPSSTAPPAPAPLALSPGHVGPVHVGMTKAQAMATGYFKADVNVGGCAGVEPLQWKPPYVDQVDVLTNASGTITSMGVFGSTVLATTKGIHVGDTLADINAAYGASVSPALEAGFDQSGVFVNVGSDWLGFLFDTPLAGVNPASTVHFMEVTNGSKPALIRDGC